MLAYDIIVIGAGVAGLNAAITGARHGRRTLLIDALGAGGQVINVDHIDNFPGAGEGMAGFELGPVLQMQADTAGVELALDTIETIEQISGGFHIVGAELDLRGSCLIIAAGSAKRKLSIPGETAFVGRGVSHCASCDGPLMKGREVCVIGGGDSALDEALTLAEHAAQVTIIHRGSRLGASASLQDRCRQKTNINVNLNAVVDAILGEDGVSALAVRDLLTGATREIACHGVFIEIGLEPNTHFLNGLAALAPDGRIEVDLGMRASQPGLFAAGDIRMDSVALLAASAGDGVTAAISAVAYLDQIGGSAGPQGQPMHKEMELGQ